MKSSKLLQRSSDSYDSGIDSPPKLNSTVSSYSVKMLPLTETRQPVAATKSPSFSSHLKIANDTYDQVYSSPSNSNSSALSSASSSSSSGYLMSPLDESGYLVPIINLVNNCCNDSTKLTNNNNNIISFVKSSPANSADTVAQLTRSQSTRSAYTTSSNLTSSSSFYSHFNAGHQYNHPHQYNQQQQNRATICEQQSEENVTENRQNVCIKCNCRLDKSKQILNNNINNNNSVHFEQVSSFIWFLIREDISD